MSTTVLCIGGPWHGRVLEVNGTRVRVHVEGGDSLVYVVRRFVLEPAGPRLRHPVVLNVAYLDGSEVDSLLVWQTILTENARLAVLVEP